MSINNNLNAEVDVVGLFFFYQQKLGKIDRMKFHFNKLKSALLEPGISEHSIVKNLSLVSKGFTSDRKKITDYVMDRSMVSAYTLFYLPSNMPKLDFVFDMLSDELKEDIKNSQVVDLGTGPGTFAFALDEYFDGNISVTGVDSSKLMVEQATKINSTLYKNERISFVNSYPESVIGETLLLGHSLNEMGLNSLMKIIGEYEPRNLIIIEPGTSDVFKIVVKLRTAMKDLGYSCAYPCANISSPCPVAKKVEGGEEDWCHQVLRMTHDSEFERLSQIVKLDRKVMPLIAHVYTKTRSVDTHKARMIRFLRETKFSFEWEVCIEREGALITATFEILKKPLSKKEIKEMQKLSVGIDFEYTMIKELSERRFRVALT